MYIDDIDDIDDDLLWFVMWYKNGDKDGDILCDNVSGDRCVFGNGSSIPSTVNFLSIKFSEKFRHDWYVQLRLVV